MTDKPVLNAEQARQGKTGLGVRHVLATGIVLVVIAFLLIWLFR